MPAKTRPCPPLNTEQTRCVLRRIGFREHGCWLWAGDLDGNGYGMVALNGFQYRAHRIVYALFVGDPGTDMVLDHMCYNKACVNPAHLDPVTQQENVTRSSYHRARKHAESLGIELTDAAKWQMRVPEPRDWQPA